MGQSRNREARRGQDHLLLGARGDGIYMLYAYTKSEQGDLTPAQVRVLGHLVREEFK